jgi:hypothetical protein
VIQDLNRQLSSSKVENESLSTTLATLRANHKKTLKDLTEAHQRELQDALKQSRNRSDSDDKDLELAYPLLTQIAQTAARRKRV